MERLTTDKPVGEMSMLELAHNCCYIDEDRNARYRDYEMDIDARDFVRKIAEAYDYELSEDNREFDDELSGELMYDPTECIEGLITLFYRSLWAMAELRERLKSYEDLEITAEQMRDIDKAYTDLCVKFGKYKKLEERLNNIFNGQITLEDVVEGLERVVLKPGSPHPVNAKMLTYAEAAEWEEYQRLKEQGLIPMCKVGDSIWDIDFGKPDACEITGYSFGTAEDYMDEPVSEKEIVYYYTNLRGSITGSFAASEIGKSVFLTKEAAEQALKELSKNDSK